MPPLTVHQGESNAIENQQALGRYGGKPQPLASILITLLLSRLTCPPPDLRYERELEAERRQAQQDRMQAHPRDMQQLQPDFQRSSLNSNSDFKIQPVSAMRTQPSIHERELHGIQRTRSGTLPTYAGYHPQQMRVAQSAVAATR